MQRLVQLHLHPGAGPFIAHCEGVLIRGIAEAFQFHPHRGTVERLEEIDLVPVKFRKSFQVACRADIVRKFDLQVGTGFLAVEDKEVVVELVGPDLFFTGILQAVTDGEARLLFVQPDRFGVFIAVAERAGRLVREFDPILTVPDLPLTVVQDLVGFEGAVFLLLFFFFVSILLLIHLFLSSIFLSN